MKLLAVVTVVAATLIIDLRAQKPQIFGEGESIVKHRHLHRHHHIDGIRGDKCPKVGEVGGDPKINIPNVTIRHRGRHQHLPVMNRKRHSGSDRDGSGQKVENNGKYYYGHENMKKGIEVREVSVQKTNNDEEQYNLPDLKGINKARRDGVSGENGGYGGEGRISFHRHRDKHFHVLAASHG